MTSGQFHSVEISSIIANREERQRRELLNIDSLANSIHRLGLIHPIVIQRSGELVAGERRLAACASLGHTHIVCQYMDELDVSHLRAIELEENVKRLSLPWQDECRAVAEYHELRKAEEPSWTQEQTADALGISAPSVIERLDIVKEMKAGNALVLGAPIFSTARGIVQRANARKDEKALIALHEVLNVASEAPEPESIINANFNEWSDTYTGPKFNFLHCDFPYGIGANRFNQGAADTHGGYSDSEDDYWRLLFSLSRNINRICTESCHIMFWYSMHYHTETLDFFQRNTDFRIDPFPLIWSKSDHAGILPDETRGPRRIYETCLFGSRGDRKIVRSTSNAQHEPSVRDSHMSIKPEPVLCKFFGMFVDSSTLMLDPTCGSGSSLRAAETLSASYVIGLEANQEFAERARQALKLSRQRRKEDGKEA